jgi:hypothetical protein
MYNMASKRFDKALQKAINLTMLAIMVSLFSLILTAAMLMYVIKFVNEFEYVEETVYSVEQDGDGVNAAVIDSKNSEVNIWDRK